MPIDAKLGVVGEVGAELEEERTEVLIDAIEVEMGSSPNRVGNFGSLFSGTSR
jgi:hypothetical protein